MSAQYHRNMNIDARHHDYNALWIHGIDTKHHLWKRLWHFYDISPCCPLDGESAVELMNNEYYWYRPVIHVSYGVKILSIPPSLSGEHDIVKNTMEVLVNIIWPRQIMQI